MGRSLKTTNIIESVNALLSRTMGDRAFAKKALEILLQTAPETMEALGKALRDSDEKGITHWAYTLKGSAANVGEEFEALREKICREFGPSGCV